MPQLDFLIILPQIFWLIFFFSLFYYVLTYYFLPIFLKTINSRKYLLENNKNIENKLTNSILERRKFLLIELNHNLNQVKIVLFIRLMHTKFNFHKKPFSLQFSKLNTKIIDAANKSILYCNYPMLNSLKFYPQILNKVKKV